MAIAYFPSLDEADTIEVAFAKADGGDLTLHLLVDSGFTGSSSFVLPSDMGNLATLPAPASHAFGAIQGAQQRAIVSCRVPMISIQVVAAAILSDLSQLALPAGVQGIAGLRFLRQFRRWGAEQAESGAWRFFLET